MIGENQITRLAIPSIHLLSHVTDKPIQPSVPIVDNVLSTVKEHMLNAVEIVKDTGKYTFTKILHQIIKYLNARVEDLLAQIEKLFVGNTALVESWCILRPTQ